MQWLTEGVNFKREGIPDRRNSPGKRVRSKCFGLNVSSTERHCNVPLPFNERMIVCQLLLLTWLWCRRAHLLDPLHNHIAQKACWGSRDTHSPHGTYHQQKMLTADVIHILIWTIYFVLNKSPWAFFLFFSFLPAAKLLPQSYCLSHTEHHAVCQFQTEHDIVIALWKRT